MQNITITQDMVVKLMLECDAKNKIYNELLNDYDARGECGESEGFVDGVKFALDTLGIYIDGINWKAEGGQANVEDNETSGS